MPEKIIRPGGRWKNGQRFPASLQDVISFYEQPATLGLANFELPWRDPGATRVRAGHI